MKTQRINNYSNQTQLNISSLFSKKKLLLSAGAIAVIAGSVYYRREIGPIAIACLAATAAVLNSTLKAMYTNKNGSVQTPYDLQLTGSEVKEITSKDKNANFMSLFGNVIFTNDSLNPVPAKNIQACRDITLTNVQATFVHSMEGKVIWTNEYLNPISTEIIDVKEGSELTNVQAKIVNSRCGPVTWENKNSDHGFPAADSVYSGGDVKLTNVQALDVGAPFGAVTWTNESLNPILAKYIVAGNDVKLTRVQAGTILSYLGTVHLVHSTAKEVLLKNMSNGNPKIIRLNDSEILENLILKPKTTDTKLEMNNLQLSIIGGKVKGNVIWDGCDGVVTLEEGAEILGTIQKREKTEPRVKGYFPVVFLD